MSEASDPNQLFTPAELSLEVVVPESTLAQWRYLGTGPAYIKAGKHVRYQRSDVEIWKATCRKGAAA